MAVFCMEVGLAARGFAGELRVLSREHVLSPTRLAMILGLLLGVAATGLGLNAVAR
jgi:hypothetical protein